MQVLKPREFGCVAGASDDNTADPKIGSFSKAMWSILKCCLHGTLNFQKTSLRLSAGNSARSCQHKLNYGFKVLAHIYVEVYSGFKRPIFVASRSARVVTVTANSTGNIVELFQPQFTFREPLEWEAPRHEVQLPLSGSIILNACVEILP